MSRSRQPREPSPTENLAARDAMGMPIEFKRRSHLWSCSAPLNSAWSCGSARRPIRFCGCAWTLSSRSPFPVQQVLSSGDRAASAPWSGNRDLTPKLVSLASVLYP